MEHFISNIVSITILLFLCITFLQSGIDKSIDWKGNLSWLKSHFSETFLSRAVPGLLFIVLLFELITSILCIVSIYQFIVYGSSLIAVWTLFLGCLTLLMLLFGQRIAKDYAGALTITCYFMVVIFGLYVVTRN